MKTNDQCDELSLEYRNAVSSMSNIAEQYENYNINSAENLNLSSSQSSSPTNACFPYVNVALSTLSHKPPYKSVTFQDDVIDDVTEFSSRNENASNNRIEESGQCFCDLCCDAKKVQITNCVDKNCVKCEQATNIIETLEDYNLSKSKFTKQKKFNSFEKCSIWLENDNHYTLNNDNGANDNKNTISILKTEQPISTAKKKTKRIRFKIKSDDPSKRERLV